MKTLGHEGNVGLSENYANANISKSDGLLLYHHFPREHCRVGVPIVKQTHVDISPTGTIPCQYGLDKTRASPCKLGNHGTLPGQESSGGLP